MTTPPLRDTLIAMLNAPVGTLEKNQRRRLAQHLMACDALVPGALTPDQNAFIHRHFPTPKPKRASNRR